MQSIMPNDREDSCFRCGATNWIECHHIFPGANRNKSERYGLKIHLCHYCHNEPPNGIHFDRVFDKETRARAQQVAMDEYGWTIEEFRHFFGKSYL